MLPPGLQQVYDQISKRADEGKALTEDELDLMEEIEYLQQDSIIQSRLEELPIARVVSGPPDRCRCCGRPFKTP
jgi:hypothetical protein